MICLQQKIKYVPQARRHRDGVGGGVQPGVVNAEGDTGKFGGVAGCELTTV